MTAYDKPPLATYAAPPVVETVLSVQFKALESFRSVHVGQLWEHFKDTFPHVTDQAPLESTVEQFPDTFDEEPTVHVRFSPTPPIPRVCFANENKTETIQVQSNRFVKNWRKSDQQVRYPRYDATIRPNFDRDYAVFVEFLQNHKLGEPRINQCEVQYRNHIIAGEQWNGLGELEKIVTFWKRPAWSEGGPEDCQVRTRFVIPDARGNPVGRLILELQPAHRKSDGRPIYVLSLTARGIIGNGTEFLDLGRHWVVRAFDSFTTDLMHRTWGRSERC